jgi:membrane protein
MLAAALFELAKRGFALFVSQFPTYTLIYGAFAALPMFLLWLYVSWLVVLAGAILTAQLTLIGEDA